MIASDPLSYVFLGCFVFSALFLVVSIMLGAGHGHTLGSGGHSLHLPQWGAHHLGGHVTSAAHPVGATTNAHPAGGGTVDSGSVSPLASLKSLFLGSLNLYGLLILLLIFGLLGYLLHNYTNIGAELSLLLALLTGLGGALLVSSLLSSLFYNREVGIVGAESSQLEGHLGKTSMGIRENGIGEVIYMNSHGGRQSIGARSADGKSIPADTDIVILSTRNGIASVQPWDRFMVDVRAGNTPLLEPIESDYE
ncbi:MAG: hypothetical protein ACLQUY_18210 [Ktedonobacterales bacterium]